MFRRLATALAAAAFAAVIAIQAPSDLMIQGEAAYRKKEFAKSAELYLKAYKADPKQRLALYNAACSLALDGQKDEAFKVLEMLVKAGFNDPEFLKQDTDFTSLREDSRWAGVVASIEENFKKNPPKPRWVKPYAMLEAPKSPEGLASKVGSEGSAVWLEGDTLSFLKKSSAKSVQLTGGIQEPMKRIGESDLWILQMRMEGWDKALVSYAFVEDGSFGQLKLSVWSGASAPAMPERAKPLKGQIIDRKIKSAALGEERSLIIYLPPNAPKKDLPAVFLADGGAARSFAEVLEALIVAKKVRPCAIVGVDNGGYRGDRNAGYDPSKDFRALEYVPGQNKERFDKHLKFFTDEVGAYVAKEFGISTKREDRAVTGFSNGGAFSAAVATRRPDFFGTSMPLSLGIPANDPKPAGPMPKVLFAAGSLESFSRSTKEVYELMKSWGIETSYDEYVAGHDSSMWELAFARLMPRAFPPR